MRLDALLADAVRPQAPGIRAQVAGAVAVVARGAVLAYEGAHGLAQTHDAGTPLADPPSVHCATRFDIASVTKLVATTAAVVALVDRAELRLTDRLETVLPDLAAGAVDPRFPELTVAQLLSHRAGLAAWEPTYLHAGEAAGALARVAALPLVSPPGRQRRYSDLSMMLLGAVVEATTRQPLAAAVERLVLGPVGLTSTGYGPVDAPVAATSWGNPYERRMIATGEPHPVHGDPDTFDGWRTYTLVGEVNDANAYHAFGGVAGHAGLFSTAADLTAFARVLLDGLAGRDTPLAAAPVIRRFLAPRSGPVLGAWQDRLDPVLGAGSGGLGHAGFTGCELLLDPVRDLIVVLLTNRQHPGEPYPSLGPLWHRLLGVVLGSAR